MERDSNRKTENINKDRNSKTLRQAKIIIKDRCRDCNEDR